MTGYFVRSVRFDELDLFAEVVRRSFITVAEEFGLSVQNCPTNGAFIRTERLVSDWNRGTQMYCLCCCGDPVGFMELKSKGDGVFELEKLSVLPEHRHKGGGSLLLEHARKEVVKAGGNRITIGIIDSNARLKEWYQKHGFVSSGTAHFPHLPFTVGFLELKIPTLNRLEE